MLKDRDYPSDLSDEQWRLVSRLLPRWSGKGSRPTDRRWVLDAILYVAGTGRLAVDTLGLVLMVVVHGGHRQDHDGACFKLFRMKENFRRLKVVFADSAYERNGAARVGQRNLRLGPAAGAAARLREGLRCP